MSNAMVSNNFRELQSLGPQCQQQELWETYSTYSGTAQQQSTPLPPEAVLSHSVSGSSGCARQDRTKGSPAPSTVWDKSATTVMIRNLPNKYTQQMLLRTLQESGFRECTHFDFFYLPMDRGNGANLGYGFVNFVDSATAGAFASAFQGCRMRHFNSRKTIDVMPALLQGYEANYQHYAGTRVAHAADHQCRPLFLREGGVAGPAPLTDIMLAQQGQITGDKCEEFICGVDAATSQGTTSSRRRRRGGANGRRGDRSGGLNNGRRDSSLEFQAEDTDFCIKMDIPEDTSRSQAHNKLETSCSFLNKCPGDFSSVSMGGSDRMKPDVHEDSGGDSDYPARSFNFELPELGCGFATPERQLSAPQESLTPAGLSPAGLQMAWGLFPMEPSSPTVEKPGQNANCYACPSCGTMMQPNFLFCPFCSATAARAPNVASLLMMQPR